MAIHLPDLAIQKAFIEAERTATVNVVYDFVARQPVIARDYIYVTSPFPYFIPRTGICPRLHRNAKYVASFPGSSAPEREIELVHAERAWYLFSRENPHRYI